MRTHTKRHRRNDVGTQHLWGFDNGRLASVVPDSDAATLWQLTVLDGHSTAHLAPASPSTTNGVASTNGAAPDAQADVIGALRPLDVRRILRKIEAL